MAKKIIWFYKDDPVHLDDDEKRIGRELGNIIPKILDSLEAEYKEWEKKNWQMKGNATPTIAENFLKDLEEKYKKGE